MSLIGHEFGGHGYDRHVRGFSCFDLKAWVHELAGFATQPI